MFERQLKITFLRLPVQQEFVSEYPYPTVQVPIPTALTLCSAQLLAHQVPWVDSID